MDLTKNLFSTLFFCLFLSIIELWCFSAYMAIDAGLFDYRTYGNFWLRTSVADFFIGFWEWLSSPQFYEFTLSQFVKKSKTVATVIILGISISVLSIYYGFSIKKRILIALGAVIWFAVFLLWLYLLN